MGGRLGVWKRVLWVWFSEWRVDGVFRWNFLGQVNGCELKASDGGFLGNFE